MTRDDIEQAVFGSLDGLTSSLGILAGLIAAHTTSSRHIIAAAIGLAVAATIGMGAGQWLSDETHSIRRALVMALATLIGSALPALPFLTGYGTTQIIAAGLITLLTATLIGHTRGYRITYTILAAVSAITILLSVLVA